MASLFKNEFAQPLGLELKFSLGGANSSVPVGSTITILGLTCANIGTQTTTVSIKVYRQNLGNSYFVVKDAPIPVGSTLSVLDGKLILEEGNQIAITTSISGSVDAILSYLELN